MSAARRHKKHHHEEHENHERWLVPGYDMMTLLFAVFVVLFAISSTNVSKIKLLTKSLQEAFSGPVLTGGRAMMETGETSQSEASSPTKPVSAISPAQAVKQIMARQTETEQAEQASDAAQAAARGAAEADREQKSFQALKRRIDKLVERAGLSDKVLTRVSRRGLNVRLLTDDLFFASGSAVIKPRAVTVLDRIGRIIAAEGKHPVDVEGHTDNRPIATSQYPSNWQLSGARAGAVVQRLGAVGVPQARMMLAGYASEHPLDSNRTPAGRAKNRRVEIVLTRLHGATSSQGGDTP
jgi:chemotaxis protein MotB